jgi:hypothetical protein
VQVTRAKAIHVKMRMISLALRCGVAALLFHPLAVPGATESIEFVGEHLAEIPMDNRYASLPLWAPWDDDAPPEWQLTAQSGFAQTHTGSLAVDGLMVSLAAGRRIAGDWQLAGLIFLDSLDLSSGVDRRPLEVRFAQGVPLDLPASAEFSGLSGSARNLGVGLAVRRTATFRLWHTYEWTAGVLWQRVALRDYSFNFRILDGADAGATGIVDYSATYSHVTPFLGIAWPPRSAIGESLHTFRPRCRCRVVVSSAASQVPATTCAVTPARQATTSLSAILR